MSDRAPHTLCDARYLGERVRIISDLGDGWLLTEWQDGRRWRLWSGQVVRGLAHEPVGAEPRSKAVRREPSASNSRIYRVWTDASVGGSRARWAAVIESPDGDREEIVEDLDCKTSSQAELSALIETLRRIPDGSIVEAFFDCKGIERVFVERREGLSVKGRDITWRRALREQLDRLDVIGERINSSPEHNRCHQLAKVSGPSVKQRRMQIKDGISDDANAINRLTRGVRA